MTDKERIRRLERLVYDLANEVQDLQLMECPHKCINSLNTEDYMRGEYIDA